jgi:hypothetical protein
MNENSVQVLIRSINDTTRVVKVESKRKIKANPGEQYEVLLDKKPLPMSVELYVGEPDLTLQWKGADLVTFEGWRELEDHAELVVASTSVWSGKCGVFSDSSQIGLLAVGGTGGTALGSDIWPTVSGISGALIQWRQFRDRRWQTGY